MMKSIIATFTMFIICFFNQPKSTHLDQLETQSKHLDRIDYYSLEWGMSSTQAMTSLELINECKRMGVVISVRSTAYLKTTVDLLSREFHVFDDYKHQHIDARTVGVLHWENGSSDTLAFNNFVFFQFKDEFYQLDSLLLNHVMEMLPHKDVKAIKWLEPFWKDQVSD